MSSRRGTLSAHVTSHASGDQSRLLCRSDSHADHGLGGSEVTVTLTEHDGQTTLVQHFVGHIRADMFPMMRQGTNEQLDKLAALLAAA